MEVSDCFLVSGVRILHFIYYIEGHYHCVTNCSRGSEGSYHHRLFVQREFFHPGGGGGGTSICMYIGYVPRERPPFSALNFHSGAYHFHKLPKSPFQSITILHILVDFAVPETIIFKMSLISTRSSPPTAGSARTQSVWQRCELAAVPEIRIFTLKMDQARSGAPHFHAQNGSSSFRSPAFSSSEWLKLVPEPHIFTLDRELVPEPLPIFHFAAAHTYQNLR